MTINTSINTTINTTIKKTTNPIVDCPDGGESLFVRIANDLIEKGWSVVADALPSALTTALVARLQILDEADFAMAGVGRRKDLVHDAQIRSDKIHWIDGQSAEERDWLQWTEALRVYLNRRLFIGLLSFESHFAHYRPGAFYSRHVDAFKDPSLQDQSLTSGTNRVLSLVAYLNQKWSIADGGELVLYCNGADGEQNTQTVIPASGTLVIFLSADVPHEVMPARRDRFSIAGWYRGDARTGDHRSQDC